MFVSDRIIGDLEPFCRGWTSVTDPMDFAAHDQPPRDDARRFEEGSQNVLGATALDASAGLMLEVGVGEIEERVIALTEMLIESLRAGDCEIATPLEPERRSGIVCFCHPTREANEVVERLTRAGIAAASRVGVVRLSPHFYNDEREIERRLAAWKPRPPAYELGYRALWIDQVTQAPEGCDFRFNVDRDWRENRG
jgi:selenocysteine lyase/cysteine desulfurase